jgi:Na+-transporting NADH:ubiquinone oxidoreductase subunit C
MSEEKKSFLESQYYPVIFMLLLSVVFVGVLSVFYRSTEKGIEEYRRQTYQLQIMSLFADTLATLTGQESSAFTDKTNVAENFAKYIRQREFPYDKNPVLGKTFYEIAVEEGYVLGYCFDITGSGLWGTMRGLLALTPDLQNIINFAIYDQMETPGLGSRVEEDWFKGQFAGKAFGIGDTKARFSLVPEEASAGTTEIRQITGATITSASVLKMIQTAAEQLQQNAVKQEQ